MVVTIVVLLILAGVSISLILDNNGIIKKSKDARKEYKQAQTNEQADLDNASKWIDDVISNKVEPENISDWGYTEDDDGTITINSYKGNDITVIIPNYINGKPVKKIECDNYVVGYDKNSIWDSNICADNFQTYWKEQKTIKKIIISEGIENIGDDAFVASVGLENIIILNCVISFGQSAFWGCIELTSITIPSSVTTIGERAFQGCTGLTNITIPSSVTTIEYNTFFGCTGLTNITIQNGVISIGKTAFWGCTELTSITIPNSVTTMGYGVFENIPSITVNVPFKKGETPEGWNANWNGTNSNCLVTVNYLK